MIDHGKFHKDQAISGWENKKNQKIWLKVFLEYFIWIRLNYLDFKFLPSPSVM